MKDGSKTAVGERSSAFSGYSRGRELGFLFFPGLDSELRQAVASILSAPVPYKIGGHIARIGDPFRDLHLVGSGSFKAYSDDTAGREHVAGFFLPGDVIGFDALYTGRYRANFVALEESSITFLPYAELRSLFERCSPLLSEVLRMMSRNIARNEVFSGDYSAEERLAGFITMMAGRYTPLHGEYGHFVLTMARRDIANYLRLSPETVSRLFTRFGKDGLIRMIGREVVLLDEDSMRGLASGMNLL